MLVSDRRVLCRALDEVAEQHVSYFISMQDKSQNSLSAASKSDIQDWTHAQSEVLTLMRVVETKLAGPVLGGAGLPQYCAGTQAAAAALAAEATQKRRCETDAEAVANYRAALQTKKVCAYCNVCSQLDLTAVLRRLQPLVR